MGDLELWIVIATLLSLILFILGGIIYLNRQKRLLRLKQFSLPMKEHGFSQEELTIIFNYFWKRQKDPMLLLEKEEWVDAICHDLHLDCENLKKRLGFDREYLIKQFEKRQEELRKKWNR